MQVTEHNREMLIEGLRQSVEEVMVTMAWSEVVFCGASQSALFSLDSGVVGMIRLHGEHDGMVGVSASHQLARELVSRMVGVSPEDLDTGDLLDGVAELANMVCGGMKTKARMAEIHLSPPVAVVGERFVAQWKTDRPTVILCFQVGEHPLAIHACV